MVGHSMVSVYTATRHNVTYTSLADFAINIANANRQGNTKKEREKLLLSFYDGYHNASQYMRFINGGYPRQQITEDDIDSLPHCCYRLMDNWLHNIKATSIKESGDNHESNIKRQRTK